MQVGLNQADPTLMFIDLNAAFAMIEQQQKPALRGRPIVVAAYLSPNGCVVSPSYEAKGLGIKVGMQVRDARRLCPDIIVLEPDPPKYRYVHLQMRRLFKGYTPIVVPKSIDEMVLDFKGTSSLKDSDLVSVGYEIKRRLKQEVGEWITCNVGISTNRFLGKTAASLHKPDGLDVITHQNLRDIYSSLSLTDLTGINYRFEARLNAAGIFTPLQFLDAPVELLKKVVFKSVVGHYWYLRLRGYEIDTVEFERRSYGQAYGLKVPTDDQAELSRYLMKLTEKMARRLRRAGYEAQGIHLWCLYRDGYWQKGNTLKVPVYATQDLYEKALLLLNQRPRGSRVTHLSVSCFKLIRNDHPQLQLFETRASQMKRIAVAMDNINDRFGEFTIVPALMAGMDEVILDRVAFGGVKDLEELAEA